MPDQGPGNIHNAYPELPVLDFQRTTVGMPAVIAYLTGAASQTPVKRAGYVIFRNESAAGQKGINNNYIGLQADGARQADQWTPLIAGTCVLRENMTNRWRRFVCFNDWTACMDILLDKVQARGLYVGGYAHPYANMHVNSDGDWPLAYWREWVTGDGTANIPAAQRNNLLSQYAAAVAALP
jgi:hypothetical protein